MPLRLRFNQQLAMHLRAPKARPSLRWSVAQQPANWYVPWRIECTGRLSQLSAWRRLCWSRTRLSPSREQRIVRELRRCIRCPAPPSLHRSAITGETMRGPSGRQQGASSTGRRMANPWWILPNHQAISTTPIRMMSPGIGRIDIHRPSYLLNDHMCRVVPRRP